jgi:hypothetical protein
MAQKKTKEKEKQNDKEMKAYEKRNSREGKTTFL